MRIDALACILVVMALVLPAQADETAGGDRLAGVLAPFLDEQTLIVARLNLMAFDPVETIDWLADLADLPAAQRDRMQGDAALAGMVTQNLPREKSVDIYVVISLADMGRLPFFLVLPIDEQSPAAAIATEARRQIEKDWQRKVVSQRIGDAMVVGSQETMDRIKADRATARPEVGAALGAAGRRALARAFVPPAALRKLVGTLFPELPKTLGGGSTKLFTDAALWVAAGIDLPPEHVAIRVFVQSADAQSAQELEREVARIAAAVGRMPQVDQAVPDFAELSKRLLPTADGDRLSLELSEDNGGIDALATLAGPVMRALGASIVPR